MSEKAAAPPPTANENATALIKRVHPVLLAFISVLTVVAILGSFAVFLMGSTYRQTEQQLEPVKSRLTFNEVQQVFMLKEQRETRIDQQKLILQVGDLTGNRPTLRPMAPLPLLPDGGP